MARARAQPAAPHCDHAGLNERRTSPLPESYGYDALGNLTQHGNATQRFEDPAHPHWITSQGVQSYTHDESGNVKSATGRYFTFDAAERLTCIRSAPTGSCNVLSVVYDASGQRVSETAGATGTYRYFHSPDYVRTAFADSQRQEWRLDVEAFGEPIAYLVVEKTVNPAAGDALPAVPLDVPPWLPPAVLLAALGLCVGVGARGGLLVGIARRPASAALSGVLIVALVVGPYPHAARAGGGYTTTYHTRFVVADPIGSAVAVFDIAGQLLHQTRYKPFGAIDAQYPAASSDPQKRDEFAGHGHQKESGLVYMNARWQDPETGVFLSIDPLVASLHDPQQHNAYSYARNNPANFIDPTGMCVLGSEGCITRLVETRMQGDVQIRVITPIDGPSSGSGQGGGGGGAGLGVGSGDISGSGIGGVLNGAGSQGNRATSSSSASTGSIGGTRRSGSGESEGVQYAWADTQANDASLWDHLFGMPPGLPENTLTGTVGPPAGAALGVGTRLLNPAINITQKGLAHVEKFHTGERAARLGKSVFNAGENLGKLIRSGTQTPMVRQANGNFSRTFDVGRNIGVDRVTGAQTSTMTVITSPSGNLVTAFPGVP